MKEKYRNEIREIRKAKRKKRRVIFISNLFYLKKKKRSCNTEIAHGAYRSSQAFVWELETFSSFDFSKK